MLETPPQFTACACVRKRLVLRSRMRIINAMTPHAETLSQRISPEACYRALQGRDARFDGCFFVGVSSTGIYCRPVCRVRLPKPENCRFFGLAAQAERAGALEYRPAGHGAQVERPREPA